MLESIGLLGCFTYNKSNDTLHLELSTVKNTDIMRTN